MYIANRIHIVGASGSGTTSLAIALATRYGHRHLDTDDLFWIRTDPPYRVKRPRDERLASLRKALTESRCWVHVRLARLRAREIERYGEDAIAAGGELHDAHANFLALHEAWLATLPCAVVRLEGNLSIAEERARIESSLENER